MKLRHITEPVIDCSDFDVFVEHCYGRKYSTVRGFRDNDLLGHYTYFSVNSDEWYANKQYEDTEEYKIWYADFIANHAVLVEDSDITSFEEWCSKTGYDAHNESPVIDEMVWHLRNDGYNVPAEFIVLVDW